MAKKAQVYARELSEDEIVDLAIRALEGPESLDALFAQEVFGGRAPLWWRDWPPHAQRAWDASVRMYFRLRDLRAMEETGAPPPQRINDHGVSVDQAWDVVLASLTQQDADRRLSWADLSYRLGTNPQRAERILRKEFGFAFAGQRPRRMLVRGPCARCGEIFDVDTDVDVGTPVSRYCPACR